MSNNEWLAALAQIADQHYGGHFTVMKFTTNWRVGFGTPATRCDIDRMWPGLTFADAAERALRNHEFDGQPRCQTHEWLLEEGIYEYPFCGGNTMPSEKELERYQKGLLALRHIMEGGTK